jgi:hypothetical protein
MPLVERTGTSRLARRVAAAAWMILMSGGPVAALADEAAAPSVEKSLTNEIAATTRFVSEVEVPRPGRAPLRARLELGSWRLTSKRKEIEVPAQGFYLAELVNGSVVTVIKGKVEERRAGDQWAVGDGERMMITITGKRQENALLQIFRVHVPAN